MGGNKLFEQIFQLQFMAKNLQKQSTKCEKEQKAELNKIKKAIEKGNTEGAKIYAQNAIRKKNEALNFLKLASRIDAVASRLKSQQAMQGVQKNMSGIVKQLQSALTTNKPEQIAMTMSKFEQQMEDLDVQAGAVEGAMGAQAALMTPENEVQELMSQVADEHNIGHLLNMPAAGTGIAVGPSAETSGAAAQSLK